MSSKRYFICLVGVVVMALLVGVACAPAQKPTPQAPDMEPRTYENQAPVPAPPQTPTPGTPTDPVRPTTLADSIADDVADMEGVKSAYVFVVARTAFVGVNLDQEMDDTKVETLKKQIVDKIKRDRVDDRVTQVMISADPDLVEQIRDIAEGRSTPDAIGDLYTRLKPEM